MKKYAIIIFTVLIMSLLTGCVTEDEPAKESVGVGDRCPDFTVTMNDGRIVSTSDLQGKPSVIVFFNTGCGDCRAEFPELQKVYDEIKARDLKANLLCISRAQGYNEIEEYWHENGLTLPFSAQEDRRVYELFATSIIPRVYILSPSLIITSQWTDNPLPTANEILSKIQ